MSRTYRRRSNHYGWNDRYYALSKFVKIEGYSFWDRVPMDPASYEYRKALAVYHSDRTSNFKEPGPSWFRNMFTERPMRRHNKRELIRFVRIDNYEPIVYSKWPLDYYT